MNRPPVTSGRAWPRCRRSPPTPPAWSAPGVHRARCAAAQSTTTAAFAPGWNVVPLTVYRDDGPHGPGSLQQFIVADLREHYFSLMPARASTFRAMAAFDVIVNNADRKSGHCLLDAEGQIWGVDNGLTFH